MEHKIGIIPVTETIFTSFNISLALITLLLITFINPLMRPSKTSEIKEIDPNVFRFGEKERNIKYLNQNNRSFAEVIENARVISLFVGFSTKMDSC